MTEMTDKNKSVKNFPNEGKAIVPKLRFPEFEGDWEIQSLDKFIDVISGIALKSDEITEFENGIPILRGINITEGFIRHSKEIDRYYPSKVNVKLEKFILEKNDLVIGMDGSKVGKNVALIDERNIGSILIQRVARIKALESANIHFIFQKIFSYEFIKYVDLVNTSSGIPHISLQQIKDFQTSFPNTILEQDKIASFLSFIDERIQTQKKIIEKLETLMKGSRKKIFSRQLKFKDEKGNEFPKWDKKKIGEILSIGSGRDYKHLNYGNIPVYGTGGIITFVDSFLYNGETVCIGRKGTIDNPMYFNEKIWTVDTLFYTHSFMNSLPKFVYYTFKNINWKEHNEASGVPSLSKNTIESIRIMIPSINEQTKIANFLSFIQEKIETEKLILEKLEFQKKYLLQNMFV